MQLSDLNHLPERNTFEFHPDSPKPDLRCDPFLLGLRDWLSNIQQRAFELTIKIDKLRFPNPKREDKYLVTRQKPIHQPYPQLTLEDLGL